MKTATPKNTEATATGTSMLSAWAVSKWLGISLKKTLELSDAGVIPAPRTLHPIAWAECDLVAWQQKKD